ncbi:hypothetical protein Ddc_22152 [Ditylenchus destructor]|nr:hypothetical protein Ddc_22152 [Ditylenchus destructor]
MAIRPARGSVTDMRRSGSSGEQDAAIDVVAGAGDISGIVRREECNQTGDVFARPFALERRRAGHPFAHLGFGEGVMEGGRDHARADGVDADIRADFLGKSTGEGHDGTLGGGIGKSARAAAITAGLRRESDDRAALGHFRQCGLRRQEQRCQIDVEDLMPEGFIHLCDCLAGDQAAGNMDEAVDLPKLVRSRRNRSLDFGGVCEIRLDRQSRAAKLFDFGNGCGRALCRAVIGKNDIGAFLCETDGACPADIPAGPGDNDGSVGKNAALENLVMLELLGKGELETLVIDIAEVDVGGKTLIVDEAENSLRLLQAVRHQKGDKAMPGGGRNRGADMVVYVEPFEFFRVDIGKTFHSADLRRTARRIDELSVEAGFSGHYSGSLTCRSAALRAYGKAIAIPGVRNIRLRRQSRNSCH